MSLSSDSQRELITILGIPFDTLDMDAVIRRIEGFVLSGQPHYVATANLNFVATAYSDPEFLEVIRTADLITPDGMPILWAARLLGHRLPERVTGADMVPRLAELAAEKGYTIFFLGGAPGVGEQAVANLRKRFAGLKAYNYSPAFNPLLEMSNSKILAQIRSVNPDILFVSLGAGKAEKWIRMTLPSLNVPVCIGVGATVDFLAGRISRAPKWMRNSGLEWLYRLSREPKRLFLRYFLDVWPFVYHFSGQWLVHTYCKLLAWRRGSVEHAIRADAEVLRVTGRLDNTSAPDLQKAGEKLLQSSRPFVIDLSGATFIDSRGLGVLAGLEKRARQQHTSVPMVWPESNAKDILILNKLDGFLSLHQSLSEARRQTASGPGQLIGESNVQGSKVRYAPQGRLDVGRSGQFKAELLEVINDNPTAKVIEVDLGEVRFMDSSGLNVLFLLYKKMQRESRELAVTNVSGQVAQIFKVMKMDKYLGNSIKT